MNGSISVQYLKDPASPDNANDAGVNLYKQIMGKFLPNARVTDGLYLYGFAKGRSFCNLLDRIPKAKLTRAALMAKANNFTETNAMNPWFLPRRHFDDVEERQVPDLGRAADRVRERRLEADRPAGRPAATGKEEVTNTHL